MSGTAHEFTGSDLDIWQQSRHVCVRCNESFFEIDNIGTWQCWQPIIGHEGCFVRADHAQEQHFAHYRYTLLNDKRFSPQFFEDLRRRSKNHIEERSMVRPEDAPSYNRALYNDYLTRRHHIILRRYDFRTERLFLEDENAMSGDFVFRENAFFPGVGKLMVVPVEGRS